MRSRTRRWGLVLTGLAMALAGTAALALWPWPSRLTEENAARIRVGVTLVEVETIVGPRGDYRTCDGEVADADLAIRPVGNPTPDDRIEHWIVNSAILAVSFDKAGRVSGSVLLPLRNKDHGPLGNLYWWLGHEWRRRFS